MDRSSFVENVTMFLRYRWGKIDIYREKPNEITLAPPLLEMRVIKYLTLRSQRVLAHNFLWIGFTAKTCMTNNKRDISTLMCSSCFIFNEGLNVKSDNIKRFSHISPH